MNKKKLLKNIILDFHNNPLPDLILRDNVPILNSGKIISVIGVRRSGKTFILFQIIKKLIEDLPIKNIVYINFEDERLKLEQTDLQLIIDAYLELYPDAKLQNTYWFFDEIQFVKGWELFVDRIYRTYSKNIFVTGSNSNLLSKEIATALRGRTIPHHVFPLDFKEFLKFKNVQFDPNWLYQTQKQAIIKNQFSEYLEWGGFPEVVFANKFLKKEILQEYLNTMIYLDIIERYNLKTPEILKYVIKRVVENITKPFSIHKIFNELKSHGYKISKNTLYDFIDAFNDVFLALSVKKYSKSILKSEFALKKLYLIDNGLINILTYVFKSNMSALLENLIAIYLHKTKNIELFYLKNGYECDFVVVFDNKKVPIQVCYDFTNNDTKDREIKGLIKAMQYLNVDDGIILTMGQEDNIKITSKNIQILPAYKFMLLNTNIASIV